MPVLSLACVVVAQMARMTRAAIIDELDRPYVEMARLKGVSPTRLVLRHALPNAIGPIVNAMALSLSYLLGGDHRVETIFNYPGLASLMVNAVTTRDMPLLQACAMIFCAAYLLLVLTADVAAILANPRLRHDERERALPSPRAAGAVAAARSWLALVGFWLVLAVIGPCVAPHPPGAGRRSRRVQPGSSAAFPLGSDYLGRDVLSRLLVGRALHRRRRRWRRR